MVIDLLSRLIYKPVYLQSITSILHLNVNGKLFALIDRFKLYKTYILVMAEN